MCFWSVLGLPVNLDSPMKSAPFQCTLWRIQTLHWDAAIVFTKRRLSLLKLSQSPQKVFIVPTHCLTCMSVSSAQVDKNTHPQCTWIYKTTVSVKAHQYLPTQNTNRSFQSGSFYAWTELCSNILLVLNVSWCMFTIMYQSSGIYTPFSYSRPLAGKDEYTNFVFTGLNWTTYNNKKKNAY